MAVSKKWKDLVHKAKALKDPWAELGFDALLERRAVRHVYNPRSKTWWKDEVMIKIQEKAFARGAMRECYRMKKLSKFSVQPDWQNASNYVAKCYMTDQPRSAYEQDVQLQMDAKMWGEKYNKRNPPKKVDFFQAYLIELNEPLNGQVLFCVEHFMEGKYIKYNSNSGYISDVNRLTPQAFSHFTFEKSDHQVIVVDIQGVGDLYTDPQIHTVDMEEYGEANLGSKGMALFFSSHLCSPLCFALGLTQFDLNDKELEKINSQCWETQPSTMVSPSEEKMMSLAAGAKRKESLTEVFERVTLTLGPLISPVVSGAQNSICSEGSPLNTPDNQTFLFENVFKKEMADKSSLLAMSGRDRTTSTDSDTVTRSMESIKRKNMDRSASVSKQIGLGGDLRHIKNKLTNLGEVHYEMAVYHSIGRFTTEPDLESSLFHLHKSGECNLTRALHELGCIYLQLPHYQLEHLSVEESKLHETMGIEYLLQAAENDCRAAMILVGRAFESGNGIGTKERDWNESVKWYSQSLKTVEVTDDSPEQDYIILARIANMYDTGGYGLAVDYQLAGDHYQQAADTALEQMKGKLANKYYMLAEEAWSKLDE